MGGSLLETRLEASSIERIKEVVLVLSYHLSDVVKKKASHVIDREISQTIASVQKFYGGIDYALFRSCCRDKGSRLCKTASANAVFTTTGKIVSKGYNSNQQKQYK